MHSLVPTETEFAGYHMDKLELIEAVHRRTGCERSDIREVVTAVFDAIGKSLADGDSVVVRGFGSFCVKQQSGRASVDIRTGRARWNKQSISPLFRPSKRLKSEVRQRWGATFQPGSAR